jgi:hypothetical protein
MRKVRVRRASKLKAASLLQRHPVPKTARAKKGMSVSEGTLIPTFTVSANSRTFSSDLRHAFEKSVAKARKENKEILGVADFQS